MLAIGIRIGESISFESGDHQLALVRMIDIDKEGNPVLNVQQGGMSWFEVSLGYHLSLTLNLGSALDTVRLFNAGYRGAEQRKLSIGAPDHIRIIRHKAQRFDPSVNDMMSLTPADGSKAVMA